MAKKPEVKPVENAAAPAPETLRQGSAPVCPICGKVCVSNRSESFFTRYYCPTAGCNYSQKVPKPNMQQRIKRSEDAESDFSAR